MGCDIHEYVEIKVNGKWIFAGTIVLYRNYSLFAVLAGVRGKIDPYIEQRGLPEDISEGLRFIAGMGKANNLEEIYKYQGDYHSHSYLSLDEIYGAEAKYKDFFNKRGEKDFNFPKALTKLNILKKLPYVEDVRFVFWFDN